MNPDILCIGSVHWDIIGRTAQPMALGADVPGRIVRRPGGVAMNIAMTLARLGLRPALLSAVGCDPEGDELTAAARALGMDCDYLVRSRSLPTDRYLAIEGANGLIAAIADAHTLEAAGTRILDALADGRLGSAKLPWSGAIALDGNLSESLLGEIAQSPLFAAADLRVAPASPGKAARLLPLLARERLTLYLNREEASVLCEHSFDDAIAAAEALHAKGAARVLVTDGPRLAADASPQGIISCRPPVVAECCVTGAGDTFMAAHWLAERHGAGRKAALQVAVDAAAMHVSGGH